VETKGAVGSFAHLLSASGRTSRPLTATSPGSGATFGARVLSPGHVNYPRPAYTLSSNRKPDATLLLAGQEDIERSRRGDLSRTGWNFGYRV
ncbi:MAG TPA: hypothetical protein VG815_20930, partial [Chloroflexota bacterium]|nr:hypothetical protein [Chloroflexota bacterium]